MFLGCPEKVNSGPATGVRPWVKGLLQLEQVRVPASATGAGQLLGGTAVKLSEGLGPSAGVGLQVTGHMYLGTSSVGWGEFTLCPNVVVEVEDHGVRNLLANWTRWHAEGPESRHGQTARAQGVCKCGDA